MTEERNNVGRKEEGMRRRLIIKTIKMRKTKTLGKSIKKHGIRKVLREREKKV